MEIVDAREVTVIVELFVLSPGIPKISLELFGTFNFDYLK